MRVLVACEESQAVCIEMRRLGHEAYSCDVIECSGGHPEWHIMQDVLPLLNGRCTFTTMDGATHSIPDRWDMIIAHPPCTFLTNTGNRWFNVERYGDKARQRLQDREEAAKFFMAFTATDCPRIIIENPIGYISTAYRKPDQIIHPYMFGDPERKATCLWFIGDIKPLVPTDIVEPIIIKYKNGRGTDSSWHMETMKLPPVRGLYYVARPSPASPVRWQNNGQAVTGNQTGGCTGSARRQGIQYKIQAERR